MAGGLFGEREKKKQQKSAKPQREEDRNEGACPFLSCVHSTLKRLVSGNAG